MLEHETSVVAVDLLSIVYIYGLYDPDTCELRYIGKSIRPWQRLSNHMNDVSVCHRTNWLKSLKHQGKVPHMEIIEEIKGGYPWQHSERLWIKYCLSKGCNLVNNTSGGDGVSGVTGEAKQRMLATWKGRKHRPSSIAKISAASLGRRHSVDTKARMSTAHTGRKILWIEKISSALRKLSAGDIEKIKSRIAQGEMVKDLASEFGVHRTTISKINTGVYCERNQSNKSRVR